MTTRAAFLASVAAALAFLGAAPPASAQWTQVAALPSSDIFTVWSRADTIVAGADTATYVSTNGGGTWHRSVRVAPAVAAVGAVWFRNGRLYAGTFGQGVFVSDDLGDHWQAFNQGLVGGIANSQLQTTQLVARGESLYVATAGAGVYVRGFVPASTWSHYGEVFEPWQASNVEDLALGGVRLVAGAGANGMTFFRDPGQADWTESFLDNTGLTPGLQAFGVAWSGSRWVVGTNAGVFHSAAGQSPWTFVNLGTGSVHNATFAVRSGRLFGAFARLTSTFFLTSADGGASWQSMETLPATFVYRMTTHGTDLYAAQENGLWVRSVTTVDVPRDGSLEGATLAFALVGAQPVGSDVRMRFVLPEASRATIDVFDARGRRVGERVSATLEAGPHVLAWDASRIAPGVYAARLTAGGRSATLRLVRTRH